MFKKTLKMLSTLIILAILLVIVFVTPLMENLWCLLTGRGYIIPKESSVFTFKPIVMNEGSGEWWLYGEDNKNYYYFTGEDDKPYQKISKNEANQCPGFVVTDYKTWNSGDKRNRNIVNTADAIDNWYGIYQYDEEPVQASNKQYDLAMIWHLEITKANSRLTVKGFQTDEDYECRSELIENGINVIFVKDLNPRYQPLYKKGDLLFQIKCDQKGRLYTYWQKMTPMLNIKYTNGEENFRKRPSDKVESEAGL